MKKLLLIAVLFSQMYAGWFFSGWCKSDRLEFLYKCEAINKVRKSRCECTLAYLEKEYATLGSYSSSIWRLSKKLTKAQGYGYDTGNYEKRDKLIEKQQNKQKKMHAWVNKCLEGY